MPCLALNRRQTLSMPLQFDVKDTSKAPPAVQVPLAAHLDEVDALLADVASLLSPTAAYQRLHRTQLLGLRSRGVRSW